MGYHTVEIPRGKYGEFSKIEEEFLELQDAVNQNNPVMMLCELTDLIGAIEGYARKWNITLDDLLRMKASTESAFKDGTRSER